MKKQKNRGITLVALIITIIVMLILVAVTVTILVDSDIIGKSEKAGALYQNAYASEGTKVSDETIVGGKHTTLEGYMQDICDHNFVDGICTKCGKKELINFTIEGKEYFAEKGMNFGEWISSEYCLDNFVWEYSVGGVALADGSTYSFVMESDHSAMVSLETKVQASGNYILNFEQTLIPITFYIDGIPYDYMEPDGGLSWGAVVYSTWLNLGLSADWSAKRILTSDGSILYNENSNSPVDPSVNIKNGDQYKTVAQ